MMKWHWPYLDLWFDVGFLELRSIVQRECRECDLIDHVHLRVRIFRRWGFKFRLYTPGLVRWRIR